MADLPSPGTAMDVNDHPANTVPDATDHHDGTVLNPNAGNPRPFGWPPHNMWDGSQKDVAPKGPDGGAGGGGSRG